MTHLSRRFIAACIAGPLVATLASCNAKRLELFTRADTVSRGGGPGSNPARSDDDVDDPDGDASDDDAAAADDDAPGAGDDDSCPAAPEPAPGVLEPTPASPEPASEPAPSPDTNPGDAGSAPAPGPSGESPAPAVDASLGPSDAGFSGTILIDDFEDGNVQAIVTGGWWYVTTDTTPGTPTLETVAAMDRPGAYVLHVAGSDYTDWGVIIGLDLRGSLGVFDATPTNAVRFWARVSVDRTFVLRLLEQDGGSYTTEVPLTTEWTEFTVPFAAFRAADDAGALDETSIVHLHYYFGIDPFEAWIDDVAFVTD